MQKYEITATATFNPGARLQLTKEQAAPRLHNLKDLGKGVYEVVRRVQFKVGEVVGHEAELPKSFANALDAGTSGSAGPTVADLKKTLTDMGIEFPKKANKDDLQKLLADAENKAADDAAAALKAAEEKAAGEKAVAIKAKALELSGMDEAAFEALPEDERDEFLDVAQEVLEQQ